MTFLVAHETQEGVLGGFSVSVGPCRGVARPERSAIGSSFDCNTSRLVTGSKRSLFIRVSHVDGLVKGENFAWFVVMKVEECGDEVVGGV